MKRNLISGALAALVLTGTAALAKDPVIYTSNPIPAVEAVQEAIKTQTGLGSGIVTGGSGVLLRRIEAEAGTPQGDIIWSTSLGTLAAFSQFFEPYEAEALAVIPDDLKAEDNLFVPANVHVVTLLVNTDHLDGQAVPASWADLADPAWKGRVIVADPANSSTGYAILYGAQKLLDADVYAKLLSNLVITGSSSAVPKGVAMGEYTVGVTFETNSYAYVDGGQEELELVYPSDGTFITADYAGLVKNGPAGEDAGKALDAILSKDAQIELLKVAFRRPSRNDIQVSEFVGLPEIKDIQVFPIDEVKAAEERDEFLKDFAAMPKADTIE